MAFALPLMMLAGTGISALSQYRQGQAAAQQAKAQANISDYNARVADANAEAIKQKGIFDQLRALKSGERRVGELTARLGSSGAQVSTGAPADILGEQRAENALDVAVIGYNSLTGAAQQTNQAAAYRNEAVNYMSTAKNMKRAGTLSAFGTGFSGIGNQYLLGGFSQFGLNAPGS